MSKPRKSWEPQYKFGGSPADAWTPAPLGENQWRTVIKVPKRKKVKRAR